MELQAYVDPGEVAFQMFGEALAPFLQDMERYRTLGQPEQASACCLGILQGIYEFDKDSSTQCREWAVGGDFSGHGLEP